MIRRVLVFPNGLKDVGYALTIRAISFLEDHGAQVFVYDQLGKLDSEEYHFTSAQGQDKNKFDIAVVLGGDGTMIQCVHYLLGTRVPIIGINLGRLGYMTEIEPEELETSLAEVLAGHFSVEERMMLQAEIEPDHGETSVYYAVNDFLIHRDLRDGLIKIQSYVNDQFLTEFRSDGVIVSSPSGSTAYNFSAGGPILTPVADNLILTPLASHAMLDRSVVLRGSDELRFYLGSFTRGDVAVFSADGRETVDVHRGTWIRIKKSQYVFRLAVVGKRSFYEVVQLKMRP